MTPARRRTLGRGLDALLGQQETGGDEARAGTAPADGGTPPRNLPIGQIRPGRYQPRRHFDPEELQALTASVREKGVLSPILVRPHPDEAGAWELIAGERRWLAAQNAKLDRIPALVRDLADQEALEIALVENIQRADLSALEEAEGYRRLMDEFRHTQEDLARVVGRSRSHIANMLRLLGLPEGVRALLADGRLTAGHARALLGTGDPDGLARRIVDRGLSVRDTERLSRSASKKEGKAGTGGKAGGKAGAKDVDTLALERELAGTLGLKVDVEHAGKAGRLVLHYRSLEQLDDLLQRLGKRL